MSNWNEYIDKPRKCTICRYDSYCGCTCPYEFRVFVCMAMEEKYFDCIDENGKKYQNTVTGKFKG